MTDDYDDIEDLDLDDQEELEDFDFEEQDVDPENEEEEEIEGIEGIEDDNLDEFEKKEVSVSISESNKNREIPNEEIFAIKKSRVIPKNKRQSNNSMSKFERAAVIGTRATHLENRAIPKIDLDQAKRIEDVIKIATIELEQNLLSDYKIKRIYTDGSYELWNLSELKI